MPKTDLIHGNALRLAEILPADHFHAVATSSPYLGHREYATGEQKSYEIGQEPLHDCLAWARGGTPCGACFVCNQRLVAEQVGRVLRPDGTYWLNLGDSYAGSGKTGGSGGKQSTHPGSFDNGGLVANFPGLKAKDLIMIPARTALALQADGWYLRSFIPWIKRNPMPGSQDDRPTTSTEFVLLLAKSPDYFFDMEGVKMPGAEQEKKRGEKAQASTRLLRESDFFFESLRAILEGAQIPLGEFAFPINTYGYPGAHFATWPPKLVEIMIRAGTSERGCCPACGAPWARVIEKGLTDHTGETETLYQKGSSAGRLALLRQAARERGEEYTNATRTVGWEPTCACSAGEPVPCRVLDPFAGSGTTLMVARQLGRDSVGVDLSETYLEQEATERLMLGAWNAWTAGQAKETKTDSLAGLPMFGGL